jgi:hypothetical protein
MTDPKTHRTRSGRTLTDEDIDAIAGEVEETDYDVEALKTRARIARAGRCGFACWHGRLCRLVGGGPLRAMGSCG